MSLFAMSSTGSFNDFVSCPYDSSHRVLRGRLTKHLERCDRNSGHSKHMLVCPFNDNHRYDAQQMPEHIKTCPGRDRWQQVNDEWDDIPAAKQAAAPLQQALPACEEDWDKEPDAPTYNPETYCTQNLVVRSDVFNGASRAGRRNLRNNERRRFAEQAQ
ncbi:hypothetical protein KR222_009563, partial [Zaprionus bogoriensis]